jgi:hypothetical protein
MTVPTSDPAFPSKIHFKMIFAIVKVIMKFTFADADDAVWWKSGLIVVDIDNVDAQGASARQLRRSFVSGYDSQSIEITNFTIKNYVGLDDAREWRLYDERVVMVAVHNVVDDVRIGAHISISR